MKRILTFLLTNLVAVLTLTFIAELVCRFCGTSVGELIGGSQREERLDKLEEAITRFGLDPADYSWYCDLRRYGGTKHAGYGLGFERMIMYVTGVSNIRDVEAFPRTTGNADF